MRAFRQIVVWLVVVGAFCVYGFIWHGQPAPGWGYWDQHRLECALSGILSWGGFGVGIATCIITAWLLLPRIQKHETGKPLGIFIFLATCATNVLTPFMVMSLPTFFWPEIRPFRGDSGLIIFEISFLMFLFSCVASGTFVLSVIFIGDLSSAFNEFTGKLSSLHNCLFPIKASQQSSTPYNGLRCVACRKPIESGSRLCPECGYTQPPF